MRHARLLLALLCTASMLGVASAGAARNPVPDIELQRLDFKPLRSIDLGQVTKGAGGRATGSYKILNLGNARLTYRTTQQPNQQGPFGRIQANQQGSVGPGSFAIARFSCGSSVADPDFTGRISGRVYVYSNDPDEGTRFFDVSCTITALTPDIELQRLDFKPLRSIDLGQVSKGGRITGSYKILNLGDARLTYRTVQQPTMQGPFSWIRAQTRHGSAGPGSFAIEKFSCGSVGPDPDFTGRISGRVYVYSNDPDEATRFFDVSCTITAARP